MDHFPEPIAPASATAPWGGQTDTTPPPPQWHFSTVPHELTDASLTDVYVRSDGDAVVVGWYPSSSWIIFEMSLMASKTFGFS